MSSSAGNTSVRNGNGAAHRKQPVNPSLKGINYVIFPGNRFAQVWDVVMILVIWYFAFFIPFQFGVSGGYYSFTNTAFQYFNGLVNLIFMVDTFLAFFRAYYDKSGRLVYSLKTIRKNYIRSGWFFINVLASLPTSSIIYKEASARMVDGDVDDLQSDNLRLVYFLFSLFKLLRLLRIRKVMETSQLLSSVWERTNVEFALTFKLLFTMVLVSHWIACIWGLLAFQQAGSLGDPQLLENLNWISVWYEGNYIEGGLNPVGWDNAIPRYWLCLFWAIQSITSIGYGNIAPVTLVEFVFANALMLICGIFWAYIIGSLIEVVQSMGSGSQAYFNHMNDANQMMADFTVKELPQSVSGAAYTKKTSKRVRRFITQQRDSATKSWLDDSTNVCTMQDAYPILSVLSPELQRASILHLTHTLLETIPYLSSKYLTPDEQAEIALQCVILEFSAGETFVAHPELGRGVLIFRQGFAVTSRSGARSSFMWAKDLSDKPIDVNEVLVEAEFCKEEQLIYHFIGFTKVFFVPRSAIVSVLEKNERAWKECGRWRYLRAALILSSVKGTGKTFEEFHECL